MPSLPSTSRHQAVMQLLALAIERMKDVHKNESVSQISDDEVKNTLDFQGESSVTSNRNYSVK